jgi:AraC-like DNA-binding protein
MMDALSDVLQSFRLTGGVFLEARFTTPWCVLSKFSPEDCRPFLADPVQMIAYHYCTRGRWLLQVVGEPAVEVRAGEAVLLPRNDPHLVCSATDLRPVDARGLVQPPEGGGALPRIVHGGGGEATHMLCGFLACERHRNPLIATLPRVLKIDMARTGSDEWIESSLRFALGGLSQGLIGATTVMSKVAELMFIEAVRRYAATLAPEQRGWLAGARDPYVGRALALLHGQPDHPWTTESLACAVSLSRSAFADRFTGVVGMPPKRYLIGWRLQLAKEKLREGCKPIAQVAHEVGYEAEAAFNRAFRREFGTPPAAWRKQAQPADLLRR